MSKCAIAYCFKTSRNLSKFLEGNDIDASNYFLASIKPRKNKKGEMTFPYNGSKVALCKIENTDVLAGGMKYCETTIDVAECSKGMEHFYASKRVKGKKIKQWVEEAMETDEDDFPELPEYKKPLTKAQVEQRKYAGAGKATLAMVVKLEKLLDEKVDEIDQLHSYSDDLYKQLQEWEEGEGKEDRYINRLKEELKEKDKEIAEYKKKEEEEYVKIDESAEKIIDLKLEVENLKEVVDTQKELIDEMKDYDLYKAFFERFSKASKAKEWIAEYQA